LEHGELTIEKRRLSDEGKVMVVKFSSRFEEMIVRLERNG
jgi:hypothetical protein